MFANPEVDWVVLMSDSITTTTEYNELLDCIKQTLATGQLRAARAVNNLLVETYWQIGREIIRRQREQGWGAPGPFAGNAAQRSLLMVVM